MTPATPNISYKFINGSNDPPRRAHADDAGLDLRSTESVTFKMLERKMVPTGLTVAIPPEYAGLVLPRSGLAWNQGIGMVNAPGLIDPGYRGEIKVILINLSHEEVSLEAGERIAQLLITKVEHLPWKEVAELPVSSRGQGGFGSTGQH